MKESRPGSPDTRDETYKTGAAEVSVADDGSLEVRIGGVPVIDRLSMVVRDRTWNEVQPEVELVKRSTGPESFSIELEMNFTGSSLDLNARVILTGSPEGRITGSLVGVTGSDSSYMRIGWTVLHSVASWKKAEYEARRAGLLVAEGIFPVEIAPQIVRDDGVEVPMIPSFDTLDSRLADGSHLRLEFSGDLFETEDQRNWTDASFKTYGTPLEKSLTEGPFEAPAFTRVEQKVSIQAESPQKDTSTPARTAGVPTMITLGEGKTPMPDIGFALPAGFSKPHSSRIDSLRSLRPSHLRAELNFASDDVNAQAEHALAAGSAVDAPLELAVFLKNCDPAEFDLVHDTCIRGRIARVLLFDTSHAVTQTDVAKAARDLLGSDSRTSSIPLVAGTNCYFAQLNAFRPNPLPAQGICWSINPQIHASDARSVFATLPIQGEVARSAAALYPESSLHVSTVSLKPPFNYDQGRLFKESDEDPNGSPTTTDQRQKDPFCMAWTLGSIAELASAGVVSITCFETTGPRGLMSDPADDEDLPDEGSRDFLYPVFGLFEALSRGGESVFVDSASSNPSRCGSLAFTQGDRLSLLVASFVDTEEQITVDWPEDRPVIQVGFDGNRWLPRKEFSSEMIEFSLNGFETVLLEQAG